MERASLKRHIISYSLLFLATLFIFSISEIIRSYLIVYELEAMFISFCAGFILFIPLVSLVLHPIILVDPENNELRNKSTLLANVGIVIVVQAVFFLIWMTDAVALYSIYVDQHSLLAKAFNITGEGRSNLSQEFYWFNMFLAWFFALLSIVIGVLPCLIARINNNGAVGNIVASFSYAKNNKLRFGCYALLFSGELFFLYSMLNICS